MRISLSVFTALGAILLFLLAQASANTALFAEYYPVLLAVNGLAALALLILVGLQVGRLIRDVRRRVFGSRLKARLLAMLALMAVLPGALVYAISMQFAVRSIDSWFDVRVDAALEGGLSLGRSVLENTEENLLEKARAMAFDLGNGHLIQASELNRLREQASADSAAIVNLNGQVDTSSTTTMGDVLPIIPTLAELRQARQGRGFTLVSDEVTGPAAGSASTGTATANGLLVRALVPLNGADFGSEPRILQLTRAVPPSIAESAHNVEQAHRDYREIQLASRSLKRIYTLTLTLALLLAFFAAFALAFFLAERLAQPLLILAEGMQAVAAGDFTPRETIATNDELGILTRSFSKMTRQLADAQQQAEDRRTALEAAQTYLESVLANLSAGVLAFDTRFRLRAANKGAMTILGDDLRGFEDIILADWPRHDQLAASIVENFAGGRGEWQAQIEIDDGAGRVQVLLLQGTALPDGGGGGYVVVFDDISTLITAQRSAAWGEVARRLAHEIKNPLTPIQLSAERLQRKLADHLNDTDRALLDRATSTIVNQVEAMKTMVNEFRDYARTPPPQLGAIDLPVLLEEVLALYENSAVSPRLTFTGPSPFPAVRADANQLRQILHNLLKNSLDALEAQTRDGDNSAAHDASPPALNLELGLDATGTRAQLHIRDNGPGFAPAILARAFEPYITTKSKGTGLGLAIVKKIIDDHGGEIRLSNNEGAVISLWLPLAESTSVTP